MPKKLLPILFIMCLWPLAIKADVRSLAEALSGRILLQVNSHGEAWYVNPADKGRYYLGSSEQAFAFLKKMSIGITNNDLKKIPIGRIEYGDKIDSDYDGLPDFFENLIGADPNKKDTDGDGYDDKTELAKNFNISGSGKMPIDSTFVQKNKGRIFLQVEAHGEAWYINPIDNKRYYIGAPAETFRIMRLFGLGISNQNLAKIYIGDSGNQPPTDSGNSTGNSTSTDNSSVDVAGNVLISAADAIKNGNVETAKKYFTSNAQGLVAYTINYLDQDGRFYLSNILASAKLSSSNDKEKIYTAETYFAFGGYKVNINYVLKKENGSWLISNI